MPHTLIEAFKSTLEELTYAALLLHVIDVSNPAWEAQLEVVEKTLEELGVADKPMLYLFNKADLLTPEDLERLRSEIFAYQPQLLIHTTSKQGIAPLVQWLKDNDLSQGERNAYQSSD